MRAVWKWLGSRWWMWLILSISEIAALVEMNWAAAIWIVVTFIWWRGYCILEDSEHAT